MGARRPSDLDEHVRAVERIPADGDPGPLVAAIADRLDAELDRVLGADWMRTWWEGIPEWHEVPGEANVFEILRLRNVVKAFDLVEYGKMRYNLLGQGDHWFPGHQADASMGRDLSSCLAASPHADAIPGLLAEAHELLAGETVKRLGSH